MGNVRKATSSWAASPSKEESPAPSSSSAAENPTPHSRSMEESPTPHSSTKEDSSPAYVAYLLQSLHDSNLLFPRYLAAAVTKHGKGKKRKAANAS